MPSFTVPPHRICGAMSNHHFLLEQNPSFRRAQVALEHRTAAACRKAFRLPKKPYRITVVVHVLFGTPAQKIGAAQVKSQIAALNKDYRARNRDRAKVPAVWLGLVTDSMIGFELATRDPAGKPTQGITYTRARVAAFGQSDAMKDPRRGGVAPWPTDRYLNIWVCEPDTGTRFAST